MGKSNKYGVWFDKGDEGFPFNWMGARVSFKLFGELRYGTVFGADTVYKTVKVELMDGRKHITVEAHIRAFNIL